MASPVSPKVVAFIETSSEVRAAMSSSKKSGSVKELETKLSNAYEGAIADIRTDKDRQIQGLTNRADISDIKRNSDATRAIVDTVYKETLGLVRKFDPSIGSEAANRPPSIRAPSQYDIDPS